MDLIVTLLAGLALLVLLAPLISLLATVFILVPLAHLAKTVAAWNASVDDSREAS